MLLGLLAFRIFRRLSRPSISDVGKHDVTFLPQPVTAISESSLRAPECNGPRRPSWKQMSIPHRPHLPARSIQSSSSSLAESTPSSVLKGSSKSHTLARRLLFPQLAPDADLPPIFLSPAASTDLNDESYDFIAIALRAYVNPWWSKLTRYDKQFLPQITLVLTAVARTLEARLIATDLSPLVFRDLPSLLTQHCIDYRNAQSKLNTSYAAGGAATLPQLFHQLQPHMALSPDGKIEEAYIRQAVDHILKASLPQEDYSPDSERFIIREIATNVLMGLLPRLSQPWFIHKLILDQLGPESIQDRDHLEVCLSPSHRGVLFPTKNIWSLCNCHSPPIISRNPPNLPDPSCSARNHPTFRSNPS